MGLETYLFDAPAHHSFQIGADGADGTVIVHGGETVSLDPEKDAEIIDSGMGMLKPSEGEADHSHREVIKGSKATRAKSGPPANQTEDEDPNVPLGQEED